MRFINKNWKPILFVSAALIFTLDVSAQQSDNLVENPSFENAQSNKLRRVGDIDRAEGWTSATGAKADLFSGDAKAPEVMIPENIYGMEEPKDGVNYAGLVAYSYREKENRSYLQTQLTSPLKKGMRYKVQFYVSLAELSMYSSNRLGAYFSKKAIGSSDKVPAIIMKETHVEHPKKELLNGRYGWDLICGEYIATGGEKFMTIGNFSNEEDIKTERVRKARDIKGKQIVAAYYYVDDVLVELLDPTEKCDCNYGDDAQTETMTVYNRAPEIRVGMSVEDKLRQYNIYYSEGRYDLRLDGENTLESIYEILEQNPNLKILVIGHSDSNEASSAEDKVVSMRRAEYVEDLLREKGVDKNRIISKDEKDNVPSPYIKEGDDDKLKAAKNRRVSFQVI